MSHLRILTRPAGSTGTDSGPAIAILNYFGPNGKRLLAELSGIVGRAGLNITECVGHSMLDTADVMTSVEGTPEAIAVAGEEWGAFVQRAANHGPSSWLQDRTHGESDRMLDYYPWSVSVKAPDEPGVQGHISDLLYQWDLDIQSYHGRLRRPRRATGDARTCLLTFTVSVPLRFDRDLFEDQLEALRARRGWMGADLTPL